MLIRSKKTGKVYEVIHSEEVPEGFEKVSRGGGIEKAVAKKPTKTVSKKSAGNDSEKNDGRDKEVETDIEKTVEEVESKTKKTADEIKGEDETGESEGDQFEWVEVDESKEAISEKNNEEDADGRA